MFLVIKSKSSSKTVITCFTTFDLVCFHASFSDTEGQLEDQQAMTNSELQCYIQEVYQIVGRLRRSIKNSIFMEWSSIALFCRVKEEGTGLNAIKTCQYLVLIQLSI